MINLLSPKQVLDLRAARINYRLRKYIVLTFFAVIGVGAIYAVGYWYADQEYSGAQKQQELAQTELKNYEPVKKRMAEYRTNLVIASKILDSQIIYSKFLVDTAQAMPSNVILGDLSFSTKPQAIGTQKDQMIIEAHTKSYSDALSLKEGLEASPIFSDVRLSQVSAPEKIPDKGIEHIYPYQASYTVKYIPSKGLNQ